MNVLCLILIAACGLPANSMLSAQGIPRGARVARSFEGTPRIMVANPFVTQATDSAAAVHIGTALRERLQDRLGNDYRVVPKEQMNEALVQYGYPPDAILNNTLAITLAKNINARTVVTGTMRKGEAGRYAVTARLTGVADEAGNVVVVTQEQGERLNDFGERIADALEPAAKALEDAKACFEQMDDRTDRAVKAAEKAVKRVPNHGLARFCLYQIAKKQNAPPAEARAHLEAAASGDPLSFTVARRLANDYIESLDTAKAIVAAQELLRIVPADQSIRKNVYQYMINARRVEEARGVAAEGVTIDPYDAEMYDLKANACLLLEDYACAVETLERMYAVDSSKADTLFFAKISAAALQIEPPDTTQVVRWTRLGVQKYPENVVLLMQLNRAYSLAGQEDSSIAVTRELIARDTSSATLLAALRAVQRLAQDDGRLAGIAPFFDFVSQHGQPRQQLQLARILFRPAMRLLQEDTATGRAQDLPRAIELARMMLTVVASDSISSDSTLPSKQVTQYANFVLGVAHLQQAGKLDSEAEAQKSWSCGVVKEEQQLLAEAKSALTKVTASPQLQVERYLTAIRGFEGRVAGLLKQHCD